MESIYGTVFKAERLRRQAEAENQELREAVLGLEGLNAALGTQKRRMDSELGQTKAELAEMATELRGAEEGTRRATSDAARLAEELRQEQEHAQAQERQRRMLEQQVKVG